MHASLRSLRFVLFILSLCGALHRAAAQTAATGSVDGRVFNAATGSALRNARVTIEGSDREALTDDFGAYRLTAPAGSVRLHVTYVGFDAQSATVDVRAGTATSRDFDLTVNGASRPATAAADEPLKLKDFTVVADREMSAQAIALNERHAAPNIKQVVAFDEFGDRGNEDIGEFMRFLPGVGIVDGGQTASSLTLRGFPDNNSAMQMDGMDIASARGNSRTQSLLDVSTANISRVEVTKVPTPDMPASGLGGSINIVTKSGFEARKPVFSYRLYYITDSYTGLTLDGGPRGPTKALSPSMQKPSYDVTALIPLSKTFAVSFGAARSWRLKPMERDDALDTQADWNFVNGFQRISTWQSLANIVNSTSMQFGADWKISAKDTLSSSFQYRYVSNNIMRLNFVATYGTGATGNANFTQGAATAVGNITQGNGTNQETGADTYHTVIKYSHKEDGWRLESSAAFSRSVSFLDDIDNGHFNTGSTTLTGIVLRGEGTGEDDGVIPVRYSATRAGAPVNVYDGANYVIGNPTSAQNKIKSDKKTGRIDFTRDFRGRVPFSLKTGVFVDQADRDAHSYSTTWNFTPNGSTTTAARQASLFPVFDTEFNAEAPTVFGKKMDWISLPKLYDLFRAHPTWFPRNDALYHQNYATNSRKLIETISAGYLRGDIRLFNNRLWLVGGVRYERTRDDGRGVLDDPSAQYQKDANGNLIRNAAGAPILLTTDALARARLRYQERANHVIREYGDFYPSLSATYNITENLLIRAAAARTIGRPNLNFIIPGSTISDPAVTTGTPTITVNNTGLKPWTADNYDLSIETYQIKGGFGSFGVFQKNIKNFFDSVSQDATPELLALYGLPDDPMYLNYKIATMTNGNDARITGYEFAYTQSLLFLPRWARGFQVFLNATKLQLHGGDVSDFSGFTPSNYAGGISFVRPRFSAKLNFTYQGETRQTLVAANAANGIPADTYNYQGERTRVSISLQYSLSKRFVVYGTMSDINGPGFNVLNRQYAPSSPEYEKARRRQELGSIIQLGVKGQF
jgi:iron complex outermembrane receptor protein